MNLDDLQREILKVTKLGGMARVPEEMLMESMECDDPVECRQMMESWITDLCGEYHLTRDQDKDMLGQTEMLFTHLHTASSELPENVAAL